MAGGAASVARCARTSALANAFRARFSMNCNEENASERRRKGAPETCPLGQLYYSVADDDTGDCYAGRRLMAAGACSIKRAARVQLAARLFTCVQRSYAPRTINARTSGAVRSVS